MSDSRAPLLSVVVRYGYFVVQARLARGPDGSSLTGMLENLGTGEKQAFEGCAGLARLIEAWGGKGVA